MGLQDVPGCASQRSRTEKPILFGIKPEWAATNLLLVKNLLRADVAAWGSACLCGLNGASPNLRALKTSCFWISYWSRCMTECQICGFSSYFPSSRIQCRLAATHHNTTELSFSSWSSIKIIGLLSLHIAWVSAVCFFFKRIQLVLLDSIQLTWALVTSGARNWESLSSSQISARVPSPLGRRAAASRTEIENQSLSFHPYHDCYIQILR